MRSLAWLNEFEALEHQGAYFFCSMPILTEAVKIATRRGLVRMD